MSPTKHLIIIAAPSTSDYSKRNFSTIHHTETAKVGYVFSLDLMILVRHGFQDAIMVRDYKRRMVASHFAPLRVRLNAIRKNNLLPKDIRVGFYF